MHAIKRILVAVKNPQSKWTAAIAKATQLAGACGAHIELFFASDTPGMDVSEALEHLARQVWGHGIGVSAAARMHHPIHESILARAESIRADLIVIDSHAGLPIAPALLQLIDWELARLSPIPVLVVRRQRLYRRPTVLAAIDPTHAYAKPLDLDARILACGTKVCEALQGTLHAVHAYVPAPFGVEPSTGVAAGTAMRVDAIAAADARKEFNKVLRAAKIPAERRHLMGGYPTDTIKHVAADIGADIVVLGSMSRSGLRRLLIGNTAEKLLYRLPCDLLLIKPTGILDVITREQRRSPVVVTPAQI
jgi:universal stress protein E